MPKKAETRDTTLLTDEEYIAFTGETYEAVRRMESGGIIPLKCCCANKKNAKGEWIFNLVYHTTAGHVAKSAQEWTMDGLAAHGVSIFVVREDKIKKQQEENKTKKD